MSLSRSIIAFLILFLLLIFFIVNSFQFLFVETTNSCFTAAQINEKHEDLQSKVNKDIKAVLLYY
jgi:hypothetical protein